MLALSKKLQQAEGIEMDTIIDLHKEYLQKVSQVCLMDTQGKFLQKEVLQFLQCVLDYRKIVKTYILEEFWFDEDSDDQQM